MTAGALLDRLLAATPPPPEGADLDHLLELAAAMVRERESLLATTPLAVQTFAESEQLAELEARQNAWNAILAAAHQRLVVQRLGATKVRAYAATLAAGCR